MSRDPRSLPIRRWLLLALVAVVLVPACATGAFVAWTEVAARSTDAVERRLKADAARWADPAWQAGPARALASGAVDFVLLDAEGWTVYRSASAPLAERGGPDHGPWQEISVREVTAPGGGTAYLYYDYEPPNGVWTVPLVALLSLLLTLLAVSLFLERSVLRQLAATSRAARGIAGGELRVDVPPSRVREIAEVGAAFSAMGEALRRSLEHEARVEQERRLFIAAIAHDLRTPLFSLRGSLEAIQQGLATTPEKLARYVAVSREKADQLERLIADLFDYSRLEYLDQTPRREPLALGALLGGVAEGLRPRAEAKGVRLVADGHADGHSVEGDPHLLRRAVENLLDNALRHTPAGGEVRVSWGAAGGEATFTVADTGPGIPAGELPRLFEPLYRGEASRNRRTGGAGLGLTIARRILRAHGGELSAANRGAGGAVFTGTLPRGDLARERPAEREGELGAAAGSGPSR